MSVQAPGRLVSIIVASVRAWRVSSKHRSVFSNRTFLVNSSSPSIINRSPSPLNSFKCFAKSIVQLGPTGNPRHYQFWINSDSTFFPSAWRVVSIACHSVFRHGMDIENRMLANSSLLNRRAVLLVRNLLPHLGLPIRHQTSGLFASYVINSFVKSTCSI